MTWWLFSFTSGVVDVRAVRFETPLFETVQMIPFAFFRFAARRTPTVATLSIQ
jgi:hypothetical protein